jgi:hypothetical protein
MSGGLNLGALQFRTDLQMRTMRGRAESGMHLDEQSEFLYERATGNGDLRKG